MKILDTPRSGKCGQTVAFQSRYGLCLRQHVPQKAALTPARQHVCAVFGNNSRKWSTRLSQEQHDRWTLAGAQVKGLDLETSATVPERPKDLQATAEPADGHPVYMHTGCTGDADQIGRPVVSPSQASTETGHGGGDAPEALLDRKKALGEEGDAPV